MEILHAPSESERTTVSVLEDANIVFESESPVTGSSDLVLSNWYHYQ